MAQKQASPQRRQPGSLRLVSKTARGKTYRRWQWRTHRRTDTGWTTVDLELGEYINCLRTRVLVALGDLKAPLLVERYARWQFSRWDELPAWTGRPDAGRGVQRSAWWVELPRQKAEPVRLRFRSLDGSVDYRRLRSLTQGMESRASELWHSLNDDPVLELARLQWQEREAQRVVDERNADIVELRRSFKRGEISKQDREADERMLLLTIDGFENIIGCSGRAYDDRLRKVIDAMPRPTRDSYRNRVLALVDRMLNDPRQQQRWRADQWDGETLSWWPAQS